jgi:hypothetical protein
MQVAHLLLGAFLMLALSAPSLALTLPWSIHVRDRSGSPLPNSTVALSFADGTSRFLVTGSAGWASTTLVKGQIYACIVSSPTLETLTFLRRAPVAPNATFVSVVVTLCDRVYYHSYLAEHRVGVTNAQELPGKDVCRINISVVDDQTSQSIKNAACILVDSTGTLRTAGTTNSAGETAFNIPERELQCLGVLAKGYVIHATYFNPGKNATSRTLRIRLRRVGPYDYPIQLGANPPLAEIQN